MTRLRPWKAWQEVVAGGEREALALMADIVKGRGIGDPGRAHGVLQEAGESITGDLGETVTITTMTTGATETGVTTISEGPQPRKWMTHLFCIKCTKALFVG